MSVIKKFRITKIKNSKPLISLKKISLSFQKNHLILDNINFTINTVDATGVDELLTNRRSTIINVINDALNRQGKEALV